MIVRHLDRHTRPGAMQNRRFPGEDHVGVILPVGDPVTVPRRPSDRRRSGAVNRHVQTGRLLRPQERSNRLEQGGFLPREMADE